MYDKSYVRRPDHESMHHAAHHACTANLLIFASSLVSFPSHYQTDHQQRADLISVSLQENLPKAQEINRYACNVRI